MNHEIQKKLLHVASELNKLESEASTLHANAPIEVAYRIPGKGGFKRKEFKTQEEADKFVDKLVAKDGDVEVRFRGASSDHIASEDEEQNWEYAATDAENIHEYANSIASYVRNHDKDSLRKQIDALKNFLDILAETVGA